MMACEGAQALGAQLERIDEAALTDAAAQGLRAGLEAIAQEARAACPVDSGTLRASIGVQVTPGRTAEGVVRADAPHAAAVEIGTLRRRAQPFLYPAYRAGRAQLTAAVAEQIRRAMRE